MNIKKTKAEILASSEDMTPVHGYVDVDVPIEILWENFTRPNIWHHWNDSFFWTFNGELELGKQLIWCFQPIRGWYFYKMPAIAKIIELEPQQKVTWEVTILPGFYARHTYYMQDLGNGRTRFGSWEKATGWSFRLMKWFWVPHFVFVKDSSLEGTRMLEKTYSHHGILHHRVLAKKNSWKFFTGLILLLFTLIAGSFAGWFYLSYVQQKAIELAPGVHVVLGGGGNSLVVQDNNDVLLVDTKFPPGSESLQKWIATNVKHPVTKIINTHYHYDHTQGNILYPDAEIFAQKNVPELMRLRDNSWWKEHENGIPTDKNLIDQTSTFKVGNQEIILTYPGIAHTHGDLYVYLPKQNIIATGDLFFNTYYPFFDTGKGGVSIPKMILAIRDIADKYPNAVFMPGHGSVANANDLRRYADYLVFLYQSVESAYKKGLSVDQAVKNIDLSQWHLNRLPSFHNGKLDWATAESNIRWVYEIFSNS